MEYNKTKRGLEKASAILGIVTASFEILISLIFIIAGFVFFSGAGNEIYYEAGDYYHINPIYVDNSGLGWVYLFAGIYLLAFAIPMMVCSIKLVGSPYNADGTLKNLQGIRVCLLVFSILAGGWIMTILLIIALCQKDYATQNQTSSGSANVSTANKNTYRLPNKPVSQPAHPVQANDDYHDFYNKIQEVKHLKELEIIDDVTFKKALTKIVAELATK